MPSARWHTTTHDAYFDDTVVELRFQCHAVTGVDGFVLILLGHREWWQQDTQAESLQLPKLGPAVSCKAFVSLDARKEWCMS